MCFQGDKHGGISGAWSSRLLKAMVAPLEYAAGMYLQELAKISRDVKLLYDKPTQRQTGTCTRSEFETTASA